MGFTFDGVHSKNMKITARIVSWQVSPAPRNAFEVIPGRMGIADLGSDTSEKYIKVICNIFPQHSFTEVIHLLDDVAEWLNPNLGLKQLVLDDIPNRYFLARLVEEVDCERILRSAGSFELTFVCPDPYGYAITDEQFTINFTGSHVVERELGNIESFPIYRMKGNISSSSSTFLTVTTNGESLKVNGPLSSNEILIVDSGLLTAKITDTSGNTVRNGLSVLDELNFPVLYPGSNEIKVNSTGAAFTELHVLSQSRWR